MNEKYLIKNTTREEREQIVNDSLGITAGQCDGCAQGLIDMYDDYTEGRRELAEINASFQRGYVRADNREADGGCSYAGGGY